MTATTSPSSRSGGGRSALWLILVVGAILAVGALSVGNRSDVAYDTDSVTPTGTRAFVDLLDSFGADVDVPTSFSPDDADIAVIFQDATGQEGAEDLRRWVRDGATLVVADPYSSLAPALDFAATPGFGPIGQEVCTVGALADVTEIDPTVGDDPSVSPSATFAVEPGDGSCFGDGDDAFAVVTPLGAGQIVALGSGTVFMNSALGKADNAALATSLLAPTSGTRVAIVEPGAFGDGIPVDETSVGSVDVIVGAALPFLVWQALAAVVVLGLAQGRRLGRPVAEPQPVQIAGSELVRAMGDLLQQAGSPTDAAAVLRRDLRREICLRVGLPPTTSPDVIAATVDARTGIGRDRLIAVIADHPVDRDRDLVELARSIDSIREEILHVPSA